MELPFITKALTYYIHPLKTIQNFKENGKLDWKLPLSVYMLALFITIIISIVVKILNPNEMGIPQSLLPFAVFTLPGIVFYTLTGTLLFKESAKNFLINLHYAILIVSLGYVWGFLTVFIIIGFIHDKAISNNVAALVYLGFLLLSRVVMNIKRYRNLKNVILKSLIEAVVVFVFVFICIGMLVVWMFNN